MYLRAFTGNKRSKHTIWVLMFLIIGAHLVAFFGWTFSTFPDKCHWTFYPTDEEFAARCHHPPIALKLPDYNIFLLIFTVIMDLIILYLPCRPVWRLQLAKRQRISILAILFAGVMYELSPLPPPNRMTDLQAYNPTSVTITNLIRLAYFVARFYGHGTFDNSTTEFRVNVIT